MRSGAFGWVSLCLVIVVERKWKFVNEITDRHAQNHFLQLTASLKQVEPEICPLGNIAASFSATVLISECGLNSALLSTSTWCCER